MKKLILITALLFVFSCQPTFQGSELEGRWKSVSFTEKEGKTINTESLNQFYIFSKHSLSSYLIEDDKKKEYEPPTQLKSLDENKFTLEISKDTVITVKYFFGESKLYLNYIDVGSTKVLKRMP
jgi:hypothetical protein